MKRQFTESKNRHHVEHGLTIVLYQRYCFYVVEFDSSIRSQSSKTI